MELVDRGVPGPRRDFAGYAGKPPRVRWPQDASVVVSLCVNYEEGSEYSLPAGDGRNEGYGEYPYALGPEVRDLGTESVYEYGSRAGIWRLLDMFDEYDVKATFFAAATALERNPGVPERIRAAGHEPCSHGWRWIDHSGLTRDEEREHIAAAVASIERTCGQRPLGWYCRGMASVNTRELLVEEGGFVYDSDAYNDDLPYFTEVAGRRHLVVPYSLTYNDGRFVMPQGYGEPGHFFQLCRRGIDELRREGRAGYPKMLSIGVHPRWIGQAGRASGLREVIEWVATQPDVIFMRRIDIARWWLDHHEEFSA